jgi:hypothetical protein
VNSTLKKKKQTHPHYTGLGCNSVLKWPGFEPHHHKRKIIQEKITRVSTFMLAVLFLDLEDSFWLGCGNAASEKPAWAVL